MVFFFIIFNRFRFIVFALLAEATSAENVGEGKKKTITIKIVRKIIYPTQDNSQSAENLANQQNHEIVHKPHKRSNNPSSNEKSNETIWWRPITRQQS